MASPRVTVVLPVYNQAHYLPAALNSVFAQSFEDYELIVVDDGSTDDTPSVLAAYLTEHDFQVIRQPNQKLPSALNTGFAHARGEYWTWTSSDNIMLPNMLSELVSALDSDPSVGLVYSDRYLMDDEGNDLGRFNVPDYDRYLLLHQNLVNCSFLYRRIYAEKAGPYDPSFIYAEDWEYWIRLSRYCCMKRVPKALYRYRLHPSSMTSEIVQGHVHDRSYAWFAARIRKTLPVRWYLGKLKWWSLRVACPHHPVLQSCLAWQQAVRNAASRHA